MTIWIILGILVVILGILIVIPFTIMNPMLNRHVNFSQLWTAEEFGIDAKHFFVKTEDGINISAYEVSVDAPRAIIICLSGIDNPSATIYFGHARMFKEQGFATILFDMRAHGKSSGKKICLGYKEYLDVKAVVKYIKSEPLYDNVPIIVLGLSMGGATAINSAGEIPEIDGVISLSAYSSWEDVLHDIILTFTPKLIADLLKPFLLLYLFLNFGKSSCYIKPKEEIKKLNGRPALLIHSRKDARCPYANFERIHENAPPYIETFVRKGELHFISMYFEEPEKDQEYSTKLIRFIDKCIVSKK